MTKKWFGVISIFPEMFDAITNYGITKQALKKQLYTLETFNLRDYTDDPARTVDDRPFGGGPGMLLKMEPLVKALQHAKSQAQAFGLPVKVILPSPQGRVFDHQGSVELAQQDYNYIFICGRYEGVDQRFIDKYVDEEWSLGDFVLTGGELAVMTMIDAVIRHIPDALHHELSAVEDSFANGLLDCPHYTRPEVFEGESVPEVLLSGHHGNIALWREHQSLKRTLERRPELISKLEAQGSLTKSQQRSLAQLRGLPDPFPPRSRRKRSKKVAPEESSSES